MYTKTQISQLFDVTYWKVEQSYKYLSGLFMKSLEKKNSNIT